MSSSVGRLAFAVVGTVIGSFVGAPQLGFAIGSAIGSLAFAPDGPKVEGPRIGDTDVQSSALGVTIPYQYGTTRSAGAILWSAGLKERKEKEKQGKGGGGGSVTTYFYSASFMISFGYGPALALRRMWADGKLIYDATGENTNVTNSKYRFRFYKGDGTNAPDELIKESINRRLQGLPDVNQGSGPQQDYTTMQELIDQAAAKCVAGDERACLLEDMLRIRSFGSASASPDLNEPIQYDWYTRKADLQDSKLGWLGEQTTGSTATTTQVNDYRFTPDYSQFCHIVFDDMALSDFGNRIPNITVEILWGTTNQVISLGGSISQTVIPEVSSVTTAPTSLQGFDGDNKRLFVFSGGTHLRKFDYITRTEVSAKEDSEIQKILGVDSEGQLIITYGSVTPAVTKVEPLTMTVIDTTGSSQGNYNDPLYAARIYDGVTSNLSLMAVVNSSNDLGLLRTDGDTIDLVWGDTVADSTGSLDDVTTIGAGPMTQAQAIAGSSSLLGAAGSSALMLGSDVTNWTLYKITAQYSESSSLFDLIVSKTVLATGALGGMTVRNVVYDKTTDRAYLFFENAGAGHVKRIAPDGDIEYEVATTYPAPGPDSGFQHSTITDGILSWFNNNDLTQFVTLTGTETISNDVLTAGSASNTAQFYIAANNSVITWVGNTPYIIGLDRSPDDATVSSTKLNAIIEDICLRSGLPAADLDVTSVSNATLVWGFTIARPSSARQALESLLLPFLVDGIETDWKVKFADRQDTSARTIEEKDLGIVRGPTGDINWAETREPDHQLPQEVNLTYIDPNRDYQKGASRANRISQPVSTMFSVTKENVEIPMVIEETTAQAAAARLLYLRWLSRDTAKTKLSWQHIDLDPTDLIDFEFEDRTTTDRIVKNEIGADFTIELALARAGDPVHTIESPIAINTRGGTGRNVIQTPVPSQLFVLDIPLIYDFHDTGRSSSRFYYAVGATAEAWSSATIFGSTDGSNYDPVSSTTIDITWGVVAGKLNAPRALWITDKENTLTFAPVVDNGDIVSVSRDEIINSDANKAIIYNPSTKFAEIIQFQDVVANPDGSYTLSNLVRGRRGTEWVVDKHSNSAYFILIKDSAMYTLEHELGSLNSTRYFKAVSDGAILSSTAAKSLVLAGAPLKPWAPNNLDRSDDGSDLTVTWTRRTRVGGAWNMAGAGVETVPLNEDTEEYELYILPTGGQSVFDAFDPTDPSTYEIKKTGITSPTQVITAAELAAASLTLADTINVYVYQISGQVGRGFPGSAALAP